MENKETVLSVKDLCINFSTDNGYVQAVRGVSFDLYKGETLCIVGESGSGKSVTNKAIMGILSKNGRVVNGSIMYEGEDLTKISEDEFQRIRGHKIGMIFQDPLSSLNPIVRIGKQITEAMLINNSRTKKMYNELVAKSLTAYKNAKTELKSGLAKGNENIKFLNAEKKKHIELAKNEAYNEINGRLYTAKQNFGAKVFELQSQLAQQVEELNKVSNLSRKKCDCKYKEIIARISKQYNDKNSDSKKDFLRAKKEVQADYRKECLIIADKYKKEYAGFKAEYKQDFESLKAEYDSETTFIKQQKGTIFAQAKENCARIEKEYDEKIANAKKEYLETKPTLIEKYKPIIAEAKKQFEKDSVVAKQKVKEYESKIKKEYYQKVAQIYKVNANSSKAKLNAELAKAKKEYTSLLRITKEEAKATALEIMKEVGIKDPEKRFNQYPFEFSGGMRQRIVIAIALTANPDVLICDEPTTALDVTIQAQILELINRLKKERNLSCIFITHDLGVVANMADRVAVMYAGKIVEYGKEEEIFYNPKHPYTWALLSSIPDVDSNERLDAIPGTPPNMIYPPKGDAFALRSKYAMAIDFKKEPPFFKVSDTHYAATWLLDPRAPKVEMPAIVKSRIENSLMNNKKGDAK